ncbi:U3 small nucleolar RNA-associated protein 5 [Cryptococcus deuterogattii 2001/935-1]|nr:U3 small nucleolar RNA-associated protein 5 [Cryptococcus deuterogattii 2001/935-1]
MAPRQPVAGPSKPKHSQQPAVQSPPPPPAVSAFNSTRTLFALASPVLGQADKVQVWDVPSDRVISEWEVVGASKASSVCFTTVPSDAASKKKKRRKSGSAHGAEEEVVLVTTSKSQLLVLSTKQTEPLRILDLPAPVTAAWSEERASVLATASSLLVLSADASSISHTFALPSSLSSPSAITILPTSTTELLHVLVASSLVVTLHLELATQEVTFVSSPLPASTSSISSLLPLPLTEQGASFLVVSEDDRTISQYTLASPQSPARLSYRYASPTLSSAHSISVDPDLLAVLHESGEISLFRLPSELDLSRPQSDAKPSTVKIVEGKEERTARLCRVAFAPVDDGASGALLCGRLTGGGRVKWSRTIYELPEGGLRPSTVVKVEAQELVGGSSTSETVPIQRFVAPNTVNEAAPEDVDEVPVSQLPSDVNMAELSLGERMLAPAAQEADSGNKPAAASAGVTLDGPVNAASLTRVLVQALHTSDPALLTLCLSHRNPVLIRNTIRKMPPQLALPLLKACVERLGQGKGANKRGGGRGAAQNEQQGRGTVEWVKGVLVERGSILMTMPSLPVHLASLSQLLQTRLELNQPLQSLSGRLDLALAQITMRRIAAEQALENAKNGGQKGGEGEIYVEGESEDEDEDIIEVGEDDGEIEDIDMGGLSESDESEEEEDEEEESDEDPLDSGSDNDLLDLQAEESGSDDEEESEDED